MNAHALLTAQGWRGPGHPLHPAGDGSRGLAHHILMRRNDDGRGLGSGKEDHRAEAWWMDAFDQALRGIDVAAGGGAVVKQTRRRDGGGGGGGGGMLAKITARGAAKYTGSGGLYASFVRGGVLQGTVETPPGLGPGLLTPPDSGVETSPAPGGDGAGVGNGDGDGDRGGRKEVETKEERRKRREAKRLRKEQRRKAREAKEKKKEAGRRRAAEEKKVEKVEKKKAKKAERKAAGETKEERRARRDARRRRKEEKRRLRALGG